MVELEKENSNLFDWLINHSKKFMVGAVIFSVLISAGVIVLFFLNRPHAEAVDPNVVAEMSGGKIYLKDYQQRLSLSARKKGASKDIRATDDVKTSIINQLIDEKILERELGSRNIQITEQDLSTKAQQIFTDYNTQQESIKIQYREYVKLDVEKEKLSNAVTGWKEGTVLFCRFDRADQDDVKKKPDAKIAKEKDRSYAQKYCQDMKNRLEKAETNLDTEGINMINDSTLGQKAWLPYTVPFAENFDKDHFQPIDFQYAYDEYDQIKKLDSKKGYSMITVKDINGIESFYAVVYLTGNGKNGETTDFNKWFMDKRKIYNIKVYKDRAI